MADDVFSVLRDRYRCPAISRRDGRRCQLQIGHDGAHAHVWRDTPKISRRGRALPPAQLTRWTEEREWTEPWADGAASHGEPLRWQAFLMPSQSGQTRTSLMDIRAAELTADYVGRTVTIDLGDQPFLVGRLVSIRHKRAGSAATPDTETRLELEGPEDRRITVRFNSIGVVELL